MKILTIIVAVVALVLLASVVTGFLGQHEPSSLDYARENAEIAALERQQALSDTLNPLDIALAAIWRLLPLLALSGLATYLSSLAAAHVGRVLLERRPNELGLLPVPVGQLASVAPTALGAFHVARIQEAQRPQVPTVPHSISWHGGPPASPPIALPADPSPRPPAPSTPTFAALLESGKVGPGNPMLLGFDRATGAPVNGSWLDLYSCAVGGLSGTGKTWTAVFLAAQAALYGARLVLLDPHADNPESLASRLAPMRSRFVCEVADGPITMLAAVNLVTNELERRKAGGRGEPWLILVDEFSALQRGELAEPLGRLVEALGQEGRKLLLYGMICGQVWTATRAGGTELRDSLASAYVHRLRPAQARMLTGYTAADLPGDLLELPSGTAYLLSTAGEMRPVIIPRMAAGDVARVAQLASNSPSATPSSRATMGFRPKVRGSTREATLEAYASGHQDDQNWTAEEAEILGSLKGGKTPSEVAAAIAGATSGRKYQDAARKVADVIRRALFR